MFQCSPEILCYCCIRLVYFGREGTTLAYRNVLSVSALAAKRQPAVGDFSIRTATEDDIPTIQELAEIIWAHTYAGLICEREQRLILDDSYSYESLRKSISENTFLLAEDSGRPIGFLDMGIYGQVLYLHRLYVLPEMQRRGVGKRLLKEAISRNLHRSSGDPEKGYAPQAVVATVDTRNRSARSAYARMGFQEEYETSLIIGGVEMRVVYIVKDLLLEPQNVDGSRC